ncbi:hypothetical protein D3C83_96100 [compost metagenome]
MTKNAATSVSAAATGTTYSSGGTGTHRSSGTPRDPSLRSVRRYCQRAPKNAAR